MFEFMISLCNLYIPLSIYRKDEMKTPLTAINCKRGCLFQKEKYLHSKAEQRNLTINSTD